MLLILPEGSLWRWGSMGARALASAAVPEQVGTNRDWVQAAAHYGHWLGSRRDGTLWEWGGPGGNPGGSAGASTEPRLVDSNHHWDSLAASAAHSVALRSDGTLWTWGDNKVGELGTGPGPSQTNLVQVGTNSDWAGVCCAWQGTLALRRDGTLWAWGRVYIVGTGWGKMSDLPSPTQVCCESNWTGFITRSFVPLVQNRAGEVWEPFHAAPSAVAPAAASLRLVVPSSVPGRFATAWCGEPDICEVRADGTLWARAEPLGAFPYTPAGPWRRLGNRSDWVNLWGAAGTALGLTADGTLWTWGVDPSRAPAPDFQSRLKLAQSRLRGLFGSAPRSSAPSLFPAYDKQPRPLMRLVLTNSVPPARASGTGAR